MPLTLKTLNWKLMLVNALNTAWQAFMGVFVITDLSTAEGAAVAAVGSLLAAIRTALAELKAHYSDSVR